MTSKLKSIDLFSGIGGFSLASNWVGIETIQFVEINPFCQKRLSKNFPNIAIHDDIKTYKPEAGAADVVIGGSPCQGNSQAGKRKGLKDPRSSLWFEQLRVIQEARPNFAIWENPRGAHSQGALETVLLGLYESGYRFDAEIISAKEVGAPHFRERIFVVAYSSSLQFSEEPSPWSDQIGSQIKESFQIKESSCSMRPRRKELNFPAEPNESGLNTRFSHETRDTYWSSTESAICLLDDGVSNGLVKTFWEVNDPPDCAVAYGLGNRMDELTALGNAVVPQCAVIPLMRVQYLNNLILRDKS